MKTIFASDLAARYDRDGYATIPNLLSPEECDKLKIEARRVLDHHAKPNASVHVHVAVVSPIFRALSEDPRLVEALRQVMPEGVMFMSDKIVYKAADKAFPTPWHIDAFYWPKTRPKLSVWIPLDDVSAENGALTVIPGSHKKNWRVLENSQMQKEFFNEIAEADVKGEEIAVCEVGRGSAILFSDRLAHGSTPNTAGKDRYVIIGTYHAPAEDEPFDLDFPARKTLVSRP